MQTKQRDHLDWNSIGSISDLSLSLDRSSHALENTSDRWISFFFFSFFLTKILDAQTNVRRRRKKRHVTLSSISLSLSPTDEKYSLSRAVSLGLVFADPQNCAIDNTCVASFVALASSLEIFYARLISSRFFHAGVKWHFIFREDNFEKNVIEVFCLCCFY